jgi:hypothetical protein
MSQLEDPRNYTKYRPLSSERNPLAPQSLSPREIWEGAQSYIENLPKFDARKLPHLEQQTV